MQRVTNCVIMDEEQLLLLQKPSRQWWVAPGGKMESGESVREAVIRECWEETGLKVKKPLIRGIFTFLIEEKGKVISEWMMFTFQAKEWQGTLLKKSPEGKLKWHPARNVQTLDMAEGDRHIFQHVLTGDGVLYGTFRYTKNYQLLSCNLHNDNKDDI